MAKLSSILRAARLIDYDGRTVSAMLDLLKFRPNLLGKQSLNTLDDVRSGIDIGNTLPDGSRIKFSFSGSTNRLTAGLDDALRWFAAKGFYAPKGSKLTLGSTNLHNRETTYAWGVAGGQGKPVIALDYAGKFITHKMQVRGTGEFLSSVTVAGDFSVAGSFNIGSISPTLRGFAGGGIERSVEADWAWAIHGATKRPVIGVRDGDVHLSRAGSSAKISMLYADAANMARGRSATGTPHNIQILRLSTALYNLIIGYGQSLMSAQEGWPALPRTAEPNTFMMGQSIRPATATAAGYDTQGTAAFNPLISTVEAQVNSGRAPLDDATVAALPAGSSAEGEAIITGAVRHLARAWSDQAGAPTRNFVAVNTAVNGRTIEALSKGASPDLYSRSTGAVTKFKALADPLGSSAVAAVLWAQGEWNYVTTYGGTTDGPGYLALLNQLRADLNADIAAITGQTKPPAWLTYITSGSYVRDNVDLSISNAQVDWALSTPGVWCFGPAYPVTDKGGHLNPNGYRWMAAQAGKVLRKVMVERTGFEPLAPIKIEAIGKTIYVHFAPSSPLQFRSAYVQNVATDYAAKGFRVSDDAGTPNVASVEIIGGSIVAITLDRKPGANAFVWYASQATAGSGNLCDSDPTRSDDVFEYLAGTGMYAAENIAALVGKPYPLWNWCVPFKRAVGYSR
ncbi:hypothetical protein [Novosphingobium sp. KA1]|uniref:hypothetical protein n=1 Tax=Novosphingobium sp. (strain KA1) TaxID=164608 RepID=UPI001A8CD79D|nr:hypothetical protein [Novosphingobium sp. KA1]